MTHSRSTLSMSQLSRTGLWLGSLLAAMLAAPLHAQVYPTPEPKLNLSISAPDGRFVARLDLAYPRYRVAVESDGRIHAFDEAQFARDADRWDDIRAAGWTLVRILSHHLRPDPQIAIDKVTEALWAAGWRPGHD
jgi:hypothetical protein